MSARARGTVMLSGSAPRCAPSERSARFLLGLCLDLHADGVSPQDLGDALLSVFLELGARAGLAPDALAARLSAAGRLAPRACALRAATVAETAGRA